MATASKTLPAAQPAATASASAGRTTAGNPAPLTKVPPIPGGLQGSPSTLTSIGAAAVDTGAWFGIGSSSTKTQASQDIAAGQKDLVNSLGLGSVGTKIVAGGVIAGGAFLMLLGFGLVGLDLGLAAFKTAGSVTPVGAVSKRLRRSPERRDFVPSSRANIAEARRHANEANKARSWRARGPSRGGYKPLKPKTDDIPF